MYVRAQRRMPLQSWLEELFVLVPKEIAVRSRGRSDAVTWEMSGK